MLSVALGLELDGPSVLQCKLLLEVRLTHPRIGVNSLVLSMAGKARKKTLKCSCKITKLNWLESLLRLACMVMAGKLQGGVKHARKKFLSGPGRS